MERVKSDLAAAEEKAAMIEAQQAKSLEELESQFQQEIEKLQEFVKSQEKEFVAEIERTKVRCCICSFYFNLHNWRDVFSVNLRKRPVCFRYLSLKIKRNLRNLRQTAE